MIRIMQKIIFIVLFSSGLLSSNLQAATYGGGIGEPNNPYQIWTPEQMNAIGLEPNDWNKCFKLMADINMSAYTGTQYNAIGNLTTYFTGSFDGNRHIISNLTYNNTVDPHITFGLFICTSNATIMDLGVEDVNITTLGMNIGGLVGSRGGGGVITNCYTTGSIISSSTADSYAGGLVGYSSAGDITNCYSNCSVISSSPTSGAYHSCAGGLVGYLSSGSIINCRSAGSIYSSGNSVGTYHSSAGGLVGGMGRNSSIKNSYSSSSVTVFSSKSTVYAGGIAGTTFPGMFGPFEISNCYNEGAILAQSQKYGSQTFDSYAGGIAGSFDGNVINCYNIGPVGAISAGNIYAGGIAGGNSTINTTLKITSCFWNTETSGTAYGVGKGDHDPNNAIGKTTAEMKTRLTYISAGWDFTNETTNDVNDYWRMCVDGVDYPHLNWESVTGDFACPDGVNMEDLSYFVQRWLSEDCIWSNNYCGGSDINGSGAVDFADFAIFADNWLAGE